MSPGRVRIGFDMISAGSGFAPAAGGIAAYYESLLGRLCDRHDVDAVVAFVPPWSGRYAVPDHEKIELVPCRGLSRKRAGRVGYEQVVLPLLCRRHQTDVLFSTCNVRPALWRGPSVVVLQSLQHALLDVRTKAVRAGYLRWAMPASLRSADTVVAVTKTSRIDAIRLFDLDPERVVAVPHGASGWALELMDGPRAVAPYVLARGHPYVLMISRLYELKNHARLIAAFAEVVQRDRIPHHLVVAGGDADLTTADIERLAADAGVAERVHVLGAVPQSLVAPLYEGADAVAYVSLYETFGHPVLEALAVGRPLLTSAVGATAEVAGDAAYLADPCSVPAIAEGLRSVLLDGDLRERLASAGPRRVRDFNWTACADGSMASMHRAIARHTAS